MVILSYGYANGYLNDCGSITGFTHSNNGNTSTFTIDNGDYFKMDVTVSGGAEETKVVNNVNIGISSTVYPKIRWRYKCSNANIKAKIDVEYNDASTQGLLPDANSQTFTSGLATLDTGKTLDHIRLFADHAVGTVYYDFVLIHQGNFTLPNVAGGMNMDFPPQEALIPIPGRDTQITQHLGTESAVVTLSCDLDQGTWKRIAPADDIDGEMFLEMLHNRSGEPWHWLDTGDHQFKVSVHPKFRWEKRGNGTTRILDLILKEYSLGSKVDETHAERYGIGL